MTLSLEADLIREAKVLAARRGLSVSRMVALQLEEMVSNDRKYEAAMHRALERLENGFELSWSKPSSRAELYER
jgi:hypothetical protein